MTEVYGSYKKAQMTCGIRCHMRLEEETLGEQEVLVIGVKKSWWWRGSVQSKVRIKRKYFKDWCICSNVKT